MLNPGKMPPGGNISGGGPAAGPTAGSTTGIGTPYIGYGGAWGIPPGGYGAGTAAAAPGAGLAPPQNATQIQPVGPPQAGPGQESGRDLDDLYSGGYQTTPHGYETYPGGYVAPSGPAPGAPGAPAPSPGAPAPSAPITQAPTGATIAQMFGDRYAASEPIAGAAVMPYLQEQGGGVMGDDPVDMSTYTRSGPYGRMFTDAMEQGLRTSGYIEDPQSRIWYPWEPYARGGYVNGYQRGGEFDYWEQNEDALRVASGKGGYHPDGEWRGHGLSRGPGSGRSDEIPAQLSDGEYVMDAETVALLGDGSTDAGAQRLDEMRQNLRKHKSKNLRRGDHSQDAKKPSRYMAKGGKVAPGQMRKIAKEEVKDHEYRKPPAGHGLRKRMKKQRGGSVNEVVGAMNREIEWRV